MSSSYYEPCSSKNLEHIKADNIEDENVILRNKYNINNIIPKIRIK